VKSAQDIAVLDYWAFALGRRWAIVLERQP
jgi:hypothetical protein